MNVFAHIEGRTAAAIDALKKEGALPSDLAVPDIGADVAARPDARRHCHQLGAGAGQGRQDEAARHRGTDRSQAQGRARCCEGGHCRSRLYQSDFRAVLLARSRQHDHRPRASATARTASARMRPSTSNMSRPIRPVPCTWAIAAGAVFGDALANLLAFAGYDVTREYYVNDAGASDRGAGAAPRSCATARLWARTSAQSRRASIPATT